MEVLKDLIIWRLSVIFYRIYEIALSQEISNDILNYLTFQDYVAAATTTEQRSRKFWGDISNFTCNTETVTAKPRPITGSSSAMHPATTHTIPLFNEALENS